jgi:branched-chain amino acid transport system substrate-binding protein
MKRVFMLYTKQSQSKHMIAKALLLTCLLFGWAQLNAQPNDVLHIYLSADMSINAQAGQSIEQGLKTALSENHNRLADKKIELITLDHRGSTPRAKKHLNQFLQDPKALVLFSGMHSPPLLASRDFINTNKILVLDPWAAAGPITRFPSSQNWIFRLSIDDTKAGEFITEYAVSQKGIKKPALFLEQTGWGQSNHFTMAQALKKRNLSAATIKRFNWGLSETNARILLRDIAKSGADAVFLVANVSEGRAIVNAMASLPKEQQLPIFSHWGITGGNFSESISNVAKQTLSLSFIQTSFSFMQPLTEFQQQVYQRAALLFPQHIKQPKDIRAPAGFIHAYDLTKLLIAAVNQSQLELNDSNKRDQLRLALERIDQPVQGLIKTYQRPFTQYSDTNTDAHEALTIDDYRMAKYNSENVIVLNQNLNNDD